MIGKPRGKRFLNKYIEIGIGNRWWVRTELEHEDGTETEVKGISGPFRLKSIYLRLWMGRRVFIVDSREGFKRMSKSKRSFKCLLGMHGVG